MTKEEACKLLSCNKKNLAKILNITPSYLSKFDELTDHYESIVYVRSSLLEALKKVDVLEARCINLQQIADDAIELLRAKG